MHLLLASLLAVVASAPLALAGERSESMTVSARVIARAVVSVESQPSEIVVTEADLARGYVDVEQPLELRVRTNSRRGYLFQVANSSEAFSALELTFDQTRMTVVQESWVARPYVPGGELVRAQVRVRLGPGAVAGRHPLPVEVSATPL
ncbi:MAG TPA: hypothetical protein VNA04_01325 [Thermoanaerobaculia bacterium]|nr:hypothetical protein [Thermoanaerobaculia bacterium]